MLALLRPAIAPLIIFVAVALGVSTPPGGSITEKDEISPHMLTILFSGDDLGYVKPCG